MPRIKMGFSDSKRLPPRALVEKLVDELNNNHESGQPFIYEQEYSTGKIRALVMWDEWKELPLEERTATILAAYEQAEGKDYRTKIALASGLTIPEAAAAGMLPYLIVPILRKSDPVAFEQCQQAMLEEGATKLSKPDLLQL